MSNHLDHQFWSGFQDILSINIAARPSELDDALNEAIRLMSSNLVRFLSDEQALHHAVSGLLQSALFQVHLQRSLNLIILRLIDPTTPFSLVFIGCLALLLNGFRNPGFFRTLRTLEIHTLHLASHQKHPQRQSDQPSQFIPVLLAIGARIGLVPSSLISPTFNPSHSDLSHSEAASNSLDLDPSNESYAERKLKPLIAGLLYELCRIQKLENEIIDLFSEELIDNLFELVELTRDQEDETLNYNLIKLIIALNEQFMIAGLHHPSEKSSHQSKAQQKPSDNNIIIRIMKHRLNESKTFGENLIFILNRASHSTPEDLCVSLLILKILYLLFTTPGTHEYFYKNDLCVLVDIFIRELSNLPDEHDDLRHTYLRVLHPLLTQTQLRHHPYKREEIRQVLLSHIKYAHLQDLNPTTKRLIERNLESEWFIGVEKISGQKPQLPRLKADLIRLSSEDMMERKLSAGGSIAEVASSNTFESTVITGDSPQDFTSPSSLLSDPPLQTLSLGVAVPSNNLQPPLVVQDKQSVVQVIIADTDPCPGPSSGVFSHLLDSVSSMSLAETPSRLTTNHARSTSPISVEGSPRPSSSGSFSHSPARRPAPKPPTCKRTTVAGSNRSPDLHPHSSITPPNPQIIHDEPPRRSATSSCSSSSFADEYAVHSSDPPSDRTLAKAHRRKAPLPPSEGIRSLRGAKSVSHIGPRSHPHHPGFAPATPSLLAASHPHPRSKRVVSLATTWPSVSTLPPDFPPSSQSNSNPFAD